MYFLVSGWWVTMWISGGFCVGNSRPGVVRVGSYVVQESIANTERQY